MANNLKITDFFDKAEAKSSNESSSGGSNKDRPSDRLPGPSSGAKYPAGAEDPGFRSICNSSAKESSTISRRGTQSNISHSSTNFKRSYTQSNISNSSTNFKRSYNAMKVVNQNSKQSLKSSITKSSSKKYKYSNDDELLILTTFSKMKKTTNFQKHSNDFKSRK